MKRDCNTCVYKEGSCYPSTTIFDKDKICKSYVPDYEGYIVKLEKENVELKSRDCWKSCEYANPKAELIGQHIKDVQKLTEAKEMLNDFVEKAEQFLKE